MATHLIFHEVDDVEHWLNSPKRAELFGPMGVTVRTFHDPQGSKWVGGIVEIPDMAAFQEEIEAWSALCCHGRPCYPAGERRNSK